MAIWRIDTIKLNTAARFELNSVSPSSVWNPWYFIEFYPKRQVVFTTETPSFRSE